MAYARDPITGLRKKSGGRVVGSVNKSTSARHEVMQRVNDALAAMGVDTLTGQRLLSGLKTQKYAFGNPNPMCRPVTQTGNAESRGTEVRCANATFVARGFAQAQLAIWRALYGGLPAGDNPELGSAVKTVLDWAATQQKQSLS